MTSIHLSYAITGSMTKCHKDSLGLKLVHLWIFNDFSLVFFNVFIKINEYVNLIPYNKRAMSKLSNETTFSGLG